MIDIPENILEIFFREIQIKGKYKVIINGNKAQIIPRDEESYYKPIMNIQNLEYFNVLLMEYINAINEFITKHNIKLKDYQDLSYILNITLFNLASSDAYDLCTFLEKRISFLHDNSFSEYDNESVVLENENVKITAQRVVEDFGLETPFIMIFKIYINDSVYNLPLIRYAIDEDDKCYIYAVQMGRGRSISQDNDFKNVINKVNSGVKEYRNIAPSFTLAFNLFIQLLQSKETKEIMIPDFLFNRYKQYYGATTVTKSNAILERMMSTMSNLVGRCSNEIDGFKVSSYPLLFDSYYHIDIINMSNQNMTLKKILGSDINAH